MAAGEGEARCALRVARHPPGGLSDSASNETSGPGRIQICELRVELGYRRDDVHK